VGIGTDRNRHARQVTHSGLADLSKDRKSYSSGWIGVPALWREFAEEILHGHSDHAV
jgi:hypothetical protein